jgi:hypothetical protein
MQMIIEARLVDDQQETAPVRLAVIDRELTTSTLGLSLAEGRAQQHFVRAQCLGIAAAHSCCERCAAKLSVKGWHARQIRTVFGRVSVQSPPVRCCGCAGKRAGASFSPLIELLPIGVTPELEYLQVKWAVHLPYAAAAALLGEVLPPSGRVNSTLANWSMSSGVRRAVCPPQTRQARTHSLCGDAIPRRQELRAAPPKLQRKGARHG